MTHQAQTQISGLILAGGAGRRMGGVDKGLLQIDGTCLVSRSTRMLEPQVGQLLISANRSLERYRGWGYPVVEDPCPGYNGPLVGMLTGLAATDTDYLACVPVDAAALPQDLVARLYAALASAGTDAAVVHDGRRRQPVCCLLRKTLQTHLSAALAQGVRSPGRWLRDVGAIEVDFSDWSADFWSINTPMEFSRVATRLQSAAQ